MQYTSAQANKLLKKLEDQHAKLVADECRSSTFVAATTEDLESARPPYDYDATQERLDEIEGKIRTVKHCISVFNTTHTVGDSGMTVDQVLIYLQQLRDRIGRISRLASRLAKERRETGMRSNLIEYEYANYDVLSAKAEYFTWRDELANVQVALDTLNNSATMEIDVEA